MTLCFYCGEGTELTRGKIVILGEGRQLSMSPCARCADWMREGIILIGVVLGKSAKGWNDAPKTPEARAIWYPDPYRSGAIANMRDETFLKAFKAGPTVAFGLKKRWMFLEHGDGVKLGMWDALPTNP